MSQITTVFVGTDNPIDTLTGNSGGPVGPTGGNINIVGAGAVTVAGTPGTSTLTITVGGSEGWTVVVPSTQTIAANTGYINTNAGLTTFTLPATSLVGDEFEIRGSSAGGWTLAQNAGQNINVVGTTSTTTGVGGSISSTKQFDGLSAVCIVASTTWSVRFASGNLTIV